MSQVYELFETCVREKWIVLIRDVAMSNLISHNVAVEFSKKGQSFQSHLEYRKIVHVMAT